MLSFAALRARSCRPCLASLAHLADSYTTAAASPLRLLSVEEGGAALAAARLRPGNSHLLAEAALSPGAWLHLRLPTSAASISVHSGTAGSVAVEAVCETGGELRSILHLASSAGGDVTVSLPAQNTSLRHVRVWVPERFCSVRVESGGAVSVDRLVEAELRIDTAGSLLLGSLRCSHIQLRSRGGAVRADALQGERVAVDTGGGALAVRRLLGRRVAVLTRALTPGVGGELVLGSVFAERLRLASGGGATSLDALRVGVDAKLRTCGGALDVHACDGERGAALEASSGGGVLGCGLEKAAEAMSRLSLSAHPGPGRLSVSLPPGWRTPPRLRERSAPVEWRELALPGAATSAPPGRKAAGVVAASGARQAWIEAAEEGPQVRLELETGDGAMPALSQRSWLEGALGRERAGRIAGPA